MNFLQLIIIIIIILIVVFMPMDNDYIFICCHFISYFRSIWIIIVQNSHSKCLPEIKTYPPAVYPAK